MLNAIANTIRTVKRVEDVAGRLGGDEFAILLPRTGADGAGLLAARILDALGDADGRRAPSVSIGLAASPDLPLEDLLPRADAALYEAKADGGRCVRTAAL
jgi:diguanylate cyclase (GGDEF)-like protein